MEKEKRGGGGVCEGRTKARLEAMEATGGKGGLIITEYVVQYHSSKRATPLAHCLGLSPGLCTGGIGIENHHKQCVHFIFPLNHSSSVSACLSWMEGQSMS